MTKEENKIINIPDKKGKPIQLSQILPDVHKIFLRGLKPIIQNYYNKIDDSLFDFAEKSGNNELQTQYFDAMREVRKKKELMVRKFSENIQQVFKNFKKGQFNYFGSITQSKQQKDDSSLSLVADEELDEKLAISNIVNKANGVLHNELFAIKKRFTLLAGGSEISIDQTPTSPAVIVNAFSITLEHILIDVRVKLIMMKLLERVLLTDLNNIYHTINQFLADQGIYPHLKFSVTQQRDSQISPDQLTQHPNDRKNENQYQNTAIPDSSYEQIKNIFTHRHVPHNPNIPQYDATIVHSALNLLRLEEMNNINLREIVLSPIEIKDHLLMKLRSLDQDADNKVVNQKDEDTIDLIGMLFQFLVEDRDIPDKIQVLLVKLQIPYLHLALKDRNLFSNKANNARKLLDLMAQASIGWTEENDKRSLFINKVESIIQIILQNHQGEIDFEALIDDFEHFHEKAEKRIKVIEKRTSEKALGQERIFKAKENTAEILKEKMKNYPLPKMVSDILLNSWANVLVLTQLRHENDTDILERHIKFIDSLITVSLKDKNTSATNTQINHVCEHLEVGLKMVAFDEKSIKKIRVELFELLLQINDLNTESSHIEIIRAKEALDAKPTENKEPPEIVHFIRNKIINSQNKEIVHIDDEHHMTAKNLKTGEWIEFLTETENSRNIQAKLSWISPISHKLLFVNSRGVKVTDKSIDELAHDFRQKVARILQQVPIFERALNAIAKKMENESKLSTESSSTNESNTIQPDS